MKFLFAVVLLLVGVSVVCADVAPRPPSTKQSKSEVGSTGCGLGVTACVVLVGVWAIRSRRRIALPS